MGFSKYYLNLSIEHLVYSVLEFWTPESETLEIRNNV